MKPCGSHGYPCCLWSHVEPCGAMAIRAAFHAARSSGARSAARFAAVSARTRPAVVAAAAGSAVAGGVVASTYLPSAAICQDSALIDVSSLTTVAKTDDVGLLPQPLKPKYKTALVQIYVTNQPVGGSDKSASGHRYDAIPTLQTA